jgi:hypothetical protein
MGRIAMTWPANRSKNPSILHCVKCGVTQEAACDCGVGYQPAATYLAIKMLANAERYAGMSDRAIADEIGVDHKTVAKARAATGENSPVDTPRTGLDGRTRRPPKPRKPKLALVTDEEIPTAEECEEEEQEALYDHACELVAMMARKTRQKFFASIKKEYPNEI